MGNIGGAGKGPTYPPKNQALQEQTRTNEAYFLRGKVDFLQIVYINLIHYSGSLSVCIVCRYA